MNNEIKPSRIITSPHEVVISKNFVQAYVCSCGHPMRKYLGGRVFIGTPRFAIHNNCPKCGESGNAIPLVSGRWVQEVIKVGWWPFNNIEYKDLAFIPKDAKE